MFEQSFDIPPWRISKIVLPQHTDHAGVMWHGSCLNWLEEARVEALAEVGLAYGDLSKIGYEMPVVALEIDFLRPILHGYLVSIESWCLPSKGVRLPWLTRFLIDGDSKALEAKVTLTFVRREGFDFHVSRKIPNEISQALIALQKGPVIPS